MEYLSLDSESPDYFLVGFLRYRRLPLTSLVPSPRQKSNEEPFANADAAFTLAYAIIMLNVDQHNHNVRKNTVPMTRDDFKRNLKKVNGGSDFNQEMLDDIYTAIKWVGRAFRAGLWNCK